MMLNQSKKANAITTSAKSNANNPGVFEISDELLEQVTGGGAHGAVAFLRAYTDVSSLGLAEIYWQSESGKNLWESSKGKQ